MFRPQLWHKLRQAYIRRQDSGTYGFIVSLVVIIFHQLSRVNVFIKRQPQPGCLQFHESTSRDRVSHRFSEAKETKLPSMQGE